METASVLRIEHEYLVCVEKLTGRVFLDSFSSLEEAEEFLAENDYLLYNREYNFRDIRKLCM
jgi:hypothetical protein